MGAILALALAAAVYPQLLAVVVVILTRANPKPLLRACYLGSLCVSVGASIAVLTVFRSRASVAGTSSSRIGPAAYLIVGGLALVVAILVATRRGRALLGGVRPRLRLQRRDLPAGSAASEPTPSRLERALGEGSLPVAIIVGAVLGVPGPFDLVALGHLARGGYTTVARIVTIAVFNLIKFVLIEVPIVSYAIWPERTAAEVERFSAWMHANRLGVIAAVVGLISVVLIVRGISGLQ